MNATYIANAKKNIVVQIYFNPLKSGVFYREYFLKLRGSVFVCDWPTAIKRPPSILKKALFIEGSSRSAEAAKAMGHRRCPLILENTPQFWKTDYPWKMQAILGLRKLRKWLKLFPPSQIHIIRFAKKSWSKTTNPVLSGGLKETLPHMWGHHHQLQGLSERMTKVKRFLWTLNFTKSWFSQLSLVVN